MVVAGDHQHAAVTPAAGGVGVDEGVTGAVDAGSFAVPHAENAVVLGAGIKLELLGPPDGRRRQILVQPGPENNMVFRQEGFGPGQGEIEAGDGRALVARDIARRIEPGRLVALALNDGQPHQGLEARHVGPAAVAGVFVVKAGNGERHGDPPARACRKSRISRERVLLSKMPSMPRSASAAKS